MKRYQTSKYEILQIFIQGRNFTQSVQLSKIEISVSWDEKIQFSKTLTIESTPPQNPQKNLKKKNFKNPKFKDPINLKYIFEVQQHVEIHCYNLENTKIGVVSFKISELVSSKFNLLTLPLPSKTSQKPQIRVIFEGVIPENSSQNSKKKKNF